MNVRFHPVARAELREARAWYEERSPLSAAAFAQEVAEAIVRIAQAPARYPVAEHGTRRFVLSRFPSVTLSTPKPQDPGGSSLMGGEWRVMGKEYGADLSHLRILPRMDLLQGFRQGTLK